MFSNMLEQVILMVEDIDKEKLDKKIKQLELRCLYCAHIGKCPADKINYEHSNKCKYFLLSPTII